MIGPAQPLPYLEITDEAYARLAAQNFTVEEPTPHTLILRGRCPRCDAVIDIPVVNSIFRSSRPVRSAARHGHHTVEANSHVEPMMCTCDDQHPNRPDGAYGCGAYWTLVLSRQES